MRLELIRWATMRDGVIVIRTYVSIMNKQTYIFAHFSKNWLVVRAITRTNANLFKRYHFLMCVWTWWLDACHASSDVENFYLFLLLFFAKKKHTKKSNRRGKISCFNLISEGSFFFFCYFVQPTHTPCTLFLAKM